MNIIAGPLTKLTKEVIDGFTNDVVEKLIYSVTPIKSNGVNISVEVSVEQKNHWKKELCNLTQQIKSASDIELLVDEVSMIAGKYLGDLKLITKELRNGKGYVVIRGCPVDDGLNELPTSISRPKNKSFISESVLLGVTHAIGFNPYGFKQEKNGALVHEITPVTGKEETASSNGMVEFMMHADGAYLSRDIRPETLSLLCLIDEENTDTRLVTINSILSELEPKSLEMLSDPNFFHVPPNTFDVGDEANSLGSILDKVDGLWEMKVATHSCEPKTLAAKISLKEFINAAESNVIAHSWRPGDLLIFNNFRCLHGRGEIKGKRWLQRCYGSRKVNVGEIINLNLNPACPETQVVTPAF
ncbi:TauD/TfdA family dioxygenase [Methylobacter psychrophilus]|uniref:TauD/TfdA family dioxygenase n=1 Tax=Methylobacter psychrophilus TaxID=96941 RepID=UPI0021D4E0AC|nr:TauD/TfdA family dioxygenase [Methylobacter psychrophilus]